MTATTHMMPNVTPAMIDMSVAKSNRRLPATAGFFMAHGLANQETTHRTRTGQALFSTRAEIEQLSYALLEPLFPVTKGIRLLGMTLSSLGEKQLESELQLSLSF
jgi:hypothetical protein